MSPALTAGPKESFSCGWDQRRSLVDSPVGYAVTASGNTEDAHPAAQMRSEQQCGFTVDYRGAGVVDSDDLQARVAPHRVHVRRGQDRVGGEAQHWARERHGSLDAPEVDGPLHACLHTLGPASVPIAVATTIRPFRTSFPGLPPAAWPNADVRTVRDQTAEHFGLLNFGRVITGCPGR